MSAEYENRIVGYDLVDADQLLAHPLNFRRHPGEQRDALRGSLRELGWISPVIVNQKTGYVIDGHARVEEAISAGVKVPVAYVELAEDRENLAIAVFDRITEMAFIDYDIAEQLVADIVTDDVALQGVLSQLVEITFTPPDDGSDPFGATSPLPQTEDLCCPKCGYEWTMNREG